ncbi:MAG TPA: pyridoxal phosphate-dependent aminotransferase [Candidatus Krumholzibacteria bacterium]|nr:pyridoxal phosphate-dependent aminotransferase [Candidatus Krumholzibacteria bacterium]
MQIPAIDYLRWIRQPSTHEGVRYSFVLSGMSSPEGEFLRDIPPEELIGGFGLDHPPLAQRIAADLGRAPQEVVVQPGSHWNLTLAVAARLQQSWGPVIVEEPAYEPLRRIPSVLGAEILRLPRRRADGRMGLDLERLSKLAERSPSLLLLSHPHNPSMSSFSLEELKELAAWSRESGCAVLSDEVYLEFLPDEARHSLHEVLPEAAVIRSFTKVMGLGSIRCSVLIAERKWSAGALELSDYGPVFLPIPSQAVALRAWEQRERLYARARELARRRRPLLRDWAEGLRDILSIDLADAGIISFCRLKPAAARIAAERAREKGVNGPFGFGLDGDPDSSIWWIRDLKQRHGVLLTPGEFFEEPGGFRLGFGVAEETLVEGLKLLSGYLREATGVVP